MEYHFWHRRFWKFQEFSLTLGGSYQNLTLASFEPKALYSGSFSGLSGLVGMEGYFQSGWFLEFHYWFAQTPNRTEIHSGQEITTNNSFNDPSLTLGYRF